MNYFNCDAIPVTLILFPNCFMIERYQVIMACKGQKESTFAFGLCSSKPIHVSYFICRKNQGPHILLFFFLFCFVLTLTITGRQFLFMHNCHLRNRFFTFFRWFFCTLLIEIHADLMKPWNEKYYKYSKEYLNHNKLVI